MGRDQKINVSSELKNYSNIKIQIPRVEKKTKYKIAEYTEK